MKDIAFELEGKKYTLPKDLCIGTYVKIFKVRNLFEEDYFEPKLISIVTGADEKLLENAPREQISYLANEIAKLIPFEKPTFVDRFTLQGIEYGFIPEWKKMTFAEFADLDTLMNKKPEEMLDYLHIITAILYRPIVKQKSKHKFEIEKYDSDLMVERAELFKDKLDIEYSLGAQFFFIQFARNFSLYTRISLTQTIKISWMAMGFVWRNLRKIWNLISKKDLDGTQFSIELQTMILQDTIQFSQKRFLKSSTNSPTFWKRIGTYLKSRRKR
jgi:hypothetical protein